MAMVPHERSLVNRMQGKSFTLLGINFDESAQECKKAEEEAKITWRSWCDGSDGPIGKQWNVHGLPTLYVLDGKGVIRFKHVGAVEKELDAAVDGLVKETADGH